jgi:hypothetical protein
MGLNNLKKRWSLNTSRKHSLVEGIADLEARAPSPAIPMDSKRVLALSERQRLESPSLHTTPNFTKHIDRSPTSPRTESGHVLGSLSFEDEETSAGGEPLFYDDFPLRAIPEEFKPKTKAQDLGAMEEQQHSNKRSSCPDPKDETYDDSPKRQLRTQGPMRIVQSRDRSVLL